jgi:hypothetical protein
MSKDFPYRPLKSSQIRLMILYPGTKSSPLSCCLLEVCLGDVEYQHLNKSRAIRSGAYKALSYTWVQGIPQQDLACHSGDSLPSDIFDGNIKNGTDLAAFLRRYRSERECQTLWIDAICVVNRPRFGRYSLGYVIQLDCTG